eukprot:762633-Hanusia_phi.AAC.2
MESGDKAGEEGGSVRGSKDPNIIVMLRHQIAGREKNLEQLKQLHQRQQQELADTERDISAQEKQISELQQYLEALLRGKQEETKAPEEAGASKDIKDVGDEFDEILKMLEDTESEKEHEEGEEEGEGQDVGEFIDASKLLDIETKAATSAKKQKKTYDITKAPFNFAVEIEVGNLVHSGFLHIAGDFEDFLDFVRRSPLDVYNYEATQQDDLADRVYFVDGTAMPRKVDKNETFEEIKQQHLQSESWISLGALRLVLLEAGQDVASIVKIPPHKGCAEPMPWKQGKVLGKGAFGSVHMAMKGDGELIAGESLIFHPPPPPSW